jgi:hypothetical protein
VYVCVFSCVLYCTVLCCAVLCCVCVCCCLQSSCAMFKLAFDTRLRKERYHFAVASPAPNLFLPPPKYPPKQAAGTCFHSPLTIGKNFHYKYPTKHSTFKIPWVGRVDFQCYLFFSSWDLLRFSSLCFASAQQRANFFFFFLFKLAKITLLDNVLLYNEGGDTGDHNAFLFFSFCLFFFFHSRRVM